jgi:hypothetical protein
MTNHWRYGLLEIGAEPIAGGDVRLRRGGRIFAATWRVEQGDLVLSTAWGSRREMAGRRRDMSLRAGVLLGQIVEAWITAPRPIRLR